MTLHENREELEAKFIDKGRNLKERPWKCAMPEEKEQFVIVDGFLP